jgi:hypothetical protein
MYSIGNPWIPEREATICCWEPDKVRGDYTNPFASVIPNVFKYSDRQTKDYMRMLKEFGFTGVQFIDSCYNWCQAGSVEAFHDRLIRMMGAARQAGLKVTVWVWASFFGGHGWRDGEAVYIAQEGYTAYADPKVHAFFNKYYDIYAELAPYVDRLIGHFFDPGLLTRYEDIIAYMKLLAAKFHAMNPDVAMALDTWGSPPDYPDFIAKSDLRDYLLMEGTFPESWPGDSRGEFRRKLKANGFHVGMWGWYTVEYESDQRPAMYVNGHVLKNLYNRIRTECDAILPVTYWSEMEACHLVNIFSLYCAAQLLIDPSRDPDELLRESVEGIWSGDSADAMYFALKTIEDIRSGNDWDTYWWTRLKHRLGTSDCQADLDRIESCISRLEPLSLCKGTASTRTTLPVEPWVLVKLILPHLEQMRLLAHFKVEMIHMEKALDEKKSADYLYREMEYILIPIPKFNTWVGNFLQIEQSAQYQIASDFCRRVGIPVPVHPLRLEEQRRCALEKAGVFQKGLVEPFLFDSGFISESFLAYGKEEAIGVMESLFQDRLVEYAGEGQYRLTNWADYRYNFDMN